MLSSSSYERFGILLLACMLATACGGTDDDTGGGGSGIAPSTGTGAGGGGSASGGGAGGSSSTSTGAAGTRTAGTGATSSSVASDAALDTPDAGAVTLSDSDGGGGTPSSNTPECAAAVHLDRCCFAVEPAPRAEIEADPCFVALTEIGRARLDGTDDDCRVLGCPPCGATPPYSRITAKSASGECVFVDECADAGDCVVGIDVSLCCACMEALPASLLSAAPCVVLGTEPTSAACTTVCADICDIGCSGEIIPACMTEGDYRVCR